jgi:hypothetical protein
MTKKSDTKFKPGHSGNPQGRTPGSGWVGEARRQLQVAWDGKKEDGSDGIREKLLTLAREGDMAAIRIVAERIAPPIKACEPPVEIELAGETLTDKATAILNAMASGKIAPTQAAQLLQALGAVAKIIETDELEERIAALEAKTK